MKTNFKAVAFDMDGVLRIGQKMIPNADKTIEHMVTTAKDRAGEEEEKAKKQIEELMKSKLISAEGQVKSNERKILEEIEARAIDLSIEKVRAKLSKSLSGNDYDKYFNASIQSIEKGLMQVYS